MGRVRRAASTGDQHSVGAVSPLHRHSYHHADWTHHVPASGFDCGVLLCARRWHVGNHHLFGGIDGALLGHLF
ncbi:Uncharacterised protein [Vibrio cholerae]|nr:Uncharacterised protein [Vibrio cholerae]